MPKNKEDVVSDAFDTIRELIEFYCSLAQFAPTGETDKVKAQLLTHISNILDGFDFTPDTEEA